MQGVAVDVPGFLTIMAALSASSQTLVEHVIKKHWGWLNEPKDKDKKQEENRRHVVIHVVAGVVGAVLAWSTNLHPLSYLGLSMTDMWTNSLAAGVLVSYGGSLFDEGLGAVRAYKKQQEALHAAAAGVRAGGRRQADAPDPTVPA